jgi:N-glycosylase/DNA lyase
VKDYTELLSEYRAKKKLIKKRLKGFSNLYKAKNEKVFSELCFCLLTPQSNARRCDGAIRELKFKGLLFNGGSSAIRGILKGKARFHNKKAEYLVNARRSFNKSVLSNKDVFDMRRKLVNSIRGMGYKEASHFLRNIGLGGNMAILDRHVLKNLKRYGVIDSFPFSMSAKSYLNIEKRARAFANMIGIPMGELDLLLWSKETGAIFK